MVPEAELEVNLSIPKGRKVQFSIETFPAPFGARRPCGQPSWGTR